MLNTSARLLRVLTLLETRRDWSGAQLAERLAVIAAACRDQQVLTIDYRKHDGTESTRSVEPFRMVHLGRRWYLVAWDRDRHAWRTFRIDRLVPSHSGGPHFTPREPPAEDIAAYVMRSVRSAPMKFEAKVTVLAPAAVIAERV